MYRYNILGWITMKKKKIMSIFKQQGGIKLVGGYIKSHVFLTAMMQFVLLGQDKTGLEILRLSVSLKVKRRLERQYRKKLLEFDKQYRESISQELVPKKIWICWLQGIENAPDIVKKCFRSVCDNLSDNEIILIDYNNMKNYVQFPDYIMEKWKNGKISNAHFSDLLRLELLSRYGGIWMDATVLCTGRAIPDFIWNSDLFLYQLLKPGKDGQTHICSSWLICAKRNNKILMAAKYLCYEYWKKHNTLVDYFLLHDIITIVSEFYPEEWKKIVPYDNSTPHFLLLRLFEQYNEGIWNIIKEQTMFHKLSYKMNEEKIKIPGTYYKRIFES